MMRLAFSRFIALLLVLSVAIDPAMASAVSSYQSSPQRLTSHQSEFTAEAVNAAPALLLHPLTSRASDWIRSWVGTREWSSATTGAAWLPYEWYQRWAWVETPLSAALTTFAALGVFMGGLSDRYDGREWVWWLFPSIFYFGHLFKNPQAMKSINVAKLTIAKMGLVTLVQTLGSPYRAFEAIFAVLMFIPIQAEHLRIQTQPQKPFESRTLPETFVELRLELVLVPLILAALTRFVDYLNVDPTVLIMNPFSPSIRFLAMLSSLAATLGILGGLIFTFAQFFELSNRQGMSFEAKRKHDRLRILMWSCVILTGLGELNLILLSSYAGTLGLLSLFMGGLGVVWSSQVPRRASKGEPAKAVLRAA